MPAESTHPHAQSSYQVRLDWGLDGLGRLAQSDVVVVVDVLPEADVADAPSEDTGMERVVAASRAAGSRVVVGGLRNAAAVAAWALALQVERGERTSIAVLPLGSPDAPFAVEDLLGAGAIVAALGDLGIDHCSPDAAVAGEGFRSLRGAVRHLITASGSGRALADAGRRDEVLPAAQLDAASEVFELA